jgi:hypothetical protein
MITIRRSSAKSGAEKLLHEHNNLWSVGVSLRGAHQIKPEAISKLRIKRRRIPALDRQDEQMAHDWQIHSDQSAQGRTWKRFMSDTYKFATHRFLRHRNHLRGVAPSLPGMRHPLHIPESNLALWLNSSLNNLETTVLIEKYFVGDECFKIARETLPIGQLENRG